MFLFLFLLDIFCKGNKRYDGTTFSNEYPSSSSSFDQLNVAMHFISGLPVCPPICPPLNSDPFVSSSEENLHVRPNVLFNRKLNKYAKQFGRRFIFASTKENFSDEKDIDEEFDQISLSATTYVSFYIDIFLFISFSFDTKFNNLLISTFSNFVFYLEFSRNLRFNS